MDLFNNWGQLQGGLISILTALLIVIVGWIVVKIIVNGINRLLKLALNNEAMVRRFGAENTETTANVASKSVYYLLMLFVFVAAFQALGLSIITEPLNRLLSMVFAYLPQIFGAAILLLAAWVIATLLKQAVSAFFSKTDIEDRVSGQIESDRNKINLGSSIAELVYWAVFLLFLPAILGALSLDGLLLPIQNMLDKFLAAIPTAFAAAAVLLIGWFVAKLCKNIVTNFFKAIQIDDVGRKAGLVVEDSSKSLAEILGTLVYVVILIPVIISALNVLGLESIAQPATDMLSKIFLFLPVLFSAFIIVAIAYFIGKMVGELSTSLLNKIGFNRVLPLIGIKDCSIDLSQVAGKLVTILIVFVAVLEAVDMLGFSTLSALMGQLVILAGNILIGVLILGTGLYFANLGSDLINRSGTANASTLALTAKIAILVLTVAMALSQMGIASNIITLAFVFLVGALAVSFAIAFGIGGRDLAAQKLAIWDRRTKESDQSQFSQE